MTPTDSAPTEPEEPSLTAPATIARVRKAGQFVHRRDRRRLSVLWMALGATVVGTVVLATTAFFFVPDQFRNSAMNQALVSVAFAIAAFNVALVFRQQARIQSGKTASGNLAVKPALALLSSCQPDLFTNDELRYRKRLIKHIGRLSASIEAIPKGLGVKDPGIIRAAYERGEAMRSLQGRVAAMHTVDQWQSIGTALVRARNSYDSGQWWNLPTVEVVILPERKTWAYRIIWGLTALVSLVGLIGVVVLMSTGKLPQPAGSLVTFVVTAVLYVSLGRLGIAPDVMKESVDVVSKAQGAMIGKPEEKKAEPTAAEATKEGAGRAEVQPDHVAEVQPDQSAQPESPTGE